MLCIGAGTFVTLYFGKPSLDRARASKNWPTTIGQIEISEVGRKTDSDGRLRYFPKSVIRIPSATSGMNPRRFGLATTIFLQARILTKKQSGIIQ